MSTATHLTRSEYLAIGALADGAYWDWLHSAEAPDPWTDEEIADNRDTLMSASLRRYLATPTWTPGDTHDARVEIAAGRDPRRTLAVVSAARSAQEQADASALAKRLRADPCEACGK